MIPLELNFCYCFLWVIFNQNPLSENLATMGKIADGNIRYPNACKRTNASAHIHHISRARTRSQRDDSTHIRKALPYTTGLVGYCIATVMLLCIVALMLRSCSTGRTPSRGPTRLPSSQRPNTVVCTHTLSTRHIHTHASI